MPKLIGYVPTEEQTAAREARRAAQLAVKNAKKSKTGSKTVFDKKQGKYVSIDVAKTRAAKAERQALQLAEDAAKKAKRFGGKTIPDPNNPGKYISQSAQEVKAASEGASKVVKETGKKSGGLFSKIGKFFKKAGKVGLIAGAIAGLVAGGVYLYNKLTGKNEAKQPEPETPTTPQEPENPVTPPPVENNDDKDKVNPNPTPEENDNTVPKDYVVKKGDCVWNIAKQHLKDMNPDPNYKPTNAEILQHTKELMELNELQFEPDGYHVMIRPNDKLKLSA